MKVVAIGVSSNTMQGCWADSSGTTCVHALVEVRAVDLHPTQVPETKPLEGQSEDEARARTLVEKRTVLNLIEGFAVAIKHHLRGEDGIYYEDRALHFGLLTPRD